jgi:hypothetical protein
MKLRELLSEISLGDYHRKATLKQAGAQMSKAFGRDRSPEHMAKLDREIANRGKGLERAKVRSDKAMAAYKAKSHADALERDRANKHNLEAELAKLQGQFDPDYEYSDNYGEWNKHKNIHGQINSLKQRLANLGETATVGATSSANIASVPNPNYANKANKKKVKSVNALDSKGVSLFGGPAFKR